MVARTVERTQVFVGCVTSLAGTVLVAAPDRVCGRLGLEGQERATRALRDLRSRARPRSAARAPALAVDARPGGAERRPGRLPAPRGAAVRRAHRPRARRRAAAGADRRRRGDRPGAPSRRVLGPRAGRPAPTLSGRAVSRPAHGDRWSSHASGRQTGGMARFSLDGLAHPIVQAPMGGGASTPALAAAVSVLVVWASSRLVTGLRPRCGRTS